MKVGRTAFLEAGAVVAAIAASVCCLGPLVLAVLGLGGGALFVKFAPYRPVFEVLTAILLGGAFYMSYRKGSAAKCSTDDPCAHHESHGRVGPWIATGIVVLLTALSYLAQGL